METTTRAVGIIGKQVIKEVAKVRYCLYARKSTESEERQVLSIDSQIKEMLQMAEREGLEVVAMKRESHSAKETGQRLYRNGQSCWLNTGQTWKHGIRSS